MLFSTLLQMEVFKDLKIVRILRREEARFQAFAFQMHAFQTFLSVKIEYFGNISHKTSDLNLWVEEIVAITFH